ncbi:14-3-3 domain-containing protein [Pleurostoma richardsiae]|uniref:14-3-3 domain-containing protein n=1 Tax=Pleurostoma richardsiae TaxID=41990 RepID=A0AA38RMJ9_9PEZI|nr:14-3-3 domain-containing protein [Pleurostoma richardsiae]
MASSEVDQKFLGRLAKSVERDNAILAQILFKILGLSINLSTLLIQARKQRRLASTQVANALDLHLHIIWLSREGSIMLEQYVIPMVGNYVELKVLAYKLRASFYHIFVLFNNQPPVSTMAISTPEVAGTSPASRLAPPQINKGKGVARDEPTLATFYTHQFQGIDGGPVGLPPGFDLEPPAAFLLPAMDYLPIAHRYFKEAVALADGLLWGSHSLRLSVKTEYAAFLYECVHDAEGSRKLAKDTIAEVYEATEGIDNDMFNDACELVTVLGKMMKRGLGQSNTPRSHGQGSRSGTPSTPHAAQSAPEPQVTVTPATSAVPGFI